MAQSDEDQCYEALSLARAYVKHHAPYVSRILHGFAPYMAPGLNTLGVTDRMVLIIDPSWYIKATKKQQAGCLMHEVSHVIRGLERIAAMPDKDLANVAFDIPINQDLREAKWELPHGIYPETYGLPVGLTGEQYYELLVSKCKDPAFAQKLRGTGDAQGERGVGQGRCGGCVGNPIDRALEEEANKAMGRTTADITQIRAGAAQDIRQYQKQGRGKVPNNMIQWLPDEVDTNHRIIRWKDKLSTVLRRATGRVVSGRSDYSYRRIARRSFILGSIKPGMVSREITIGIVEDTSGSMGKEQIMESRLTSIDVFRQLGIEKAWWISADAAVSKPAQQLRLRDIRNLPIIGGGGTDFRPAIEYAQKLKPKPDVLLYMTDGDGRAPDHPPIGMEVVFCVVPSYYNKAPADWGITIIMADLPA